MNLVYHGDPYIVEQEINELKSQIDNGDPNSTNINVFDSNEVNADTILNACYSIPFLSSKRLVIIKGLLSIFESKNSSRIRVSKTNQKPKSQHPQTRNLNVKIKKSRNSKVKNYYTECCNCYSSDQCNYQSGNSTFNERRRITKRGHIDRRS